jgi:hypothetical protein
VEYRRRGGRKSQRLVWLVKRVMSLAMIVGISLVVVCSADGIERPCTRCVKKGIGQQCTEGVRKKAKYLLEADDKCTSLHELTIVINTANT